VAGTGRVLDLVQLVERDLSPVGASNGLLDVAGDDALAVPFAFGHQPTGDEHSGQIKPRRRHQHPRYDLVARGQTDQPIEAIAPRRQFDRRGDHFPARQDGVHPLSLADAVAQRDGVERQGNAPGGAHAFLHCLRHLVEVDVPRDQVVPGVGDANQRPVLGIVHATCVVQPARVRPGQISLSHYATVSTLLPPTSNL